ncbi:transposase [Rhizobium laguerreae]|uniref:transposase n=1 Tax=Rhizobium laguerreae TaxID=1076926 RepID=UPI001FE52328|nr:transposase [Rhizobium laguerreae]
MPVAASLAFTLPAKPGRKERDTQLAIRFSAVSLPAPKNGIYKKIPDGVGLCLVDVRESAPPPGETPIHWQLLTTYAVSDADQAAAVIALYRRRWAIEQLFRTLKTQGFDIEGLRIEDEAPLSNLVMAAFVAAVIVQQLVHARDGAPPGDALRPIEDAFEPSDRPLLEAFCAKRATPPGRRTRIPKAHWPMPPGSAPASAGGPATTASQARSSCSTAGNSSRPPSAAYPSSSTLSMMCESNSSARRARSRSPMNSTDLPRPCSRTSSTSSPEPVSLRAQISEVATATSGRSSKRPYECSVALRQANASPEK